MKKFISLLLILACTQSFAQLTREEHKANYERQTRIVGYSGVGVLTLLDRWEKACPDDPEAKLGRFNYYLNKGIRTELVLKNQEKFMGAKPSVTLKDENGNPANYFEETFYDESSFAESQKYIDALIGQYPDTADFRVAKLKSLLEMEKEYPDLAAGELYGLIDAYRADGGKWALHGEKVNDVIFSALIQEYCAYLFSIGSDVANTLFYDVSVKMSKLYPKDSNFLDNQGSYWMVVKGNPKKALSFYDKALKINPEDPIARKNRKIAEKRLAQGKK